MDLDCRSYEDMSAFALRAFEDMESSLEKNRLEFEKQSIRSRGLFERLLGFQLFLRNAVAISRTFGSEGGRTQGAPGEFRAETYVPLMLGHNVNYLLPAVQALEQDLMTACKALVRPVAESIQKSFYIMARPDAAKNFKLIDVYSEWVSDNPRQKHGDAVREFLRLPKPQKLMGHQITANQFGKLCEKHSAGSIRKCLYNDETLKDQAALYAHLNSSSHANTSGDFSVRCDPELSGRFMDFAAELSLLNLFMLANSQHGRLKELGLWEKSAQFVEHAAEDLGHHHRPANMYPDEAEYTKNLKIKLEPSS